MNVSLHVPKFTYDISFYNQGVHHSMFKNFSYNWSQDFKHAMVLNRVLGMYVISHWTYNPSFLSLTLDLLITKAALADLFSLAVWMTLIKFPLFYSALQVPFLEIPWDLGLILSVSDRMCNLRGHGKFDPSNSEPLETLKSTYFLSIDYMIPKNHIMISFSSNFNKCEW